MPTVFKQNVVTDIGTVPVDVLQIQEGVKATVVGCNLANNSDYDTVVVDVQVVDENSTVGNYTGSAWTSPAGASGAVSEIQANTIAASFALMLG